jgi:hypothetical protein
MKNNFSVEGFTDIFKLELGQDLFDLQKKIYNSTKELIIDHDMSLSIVDKLQLPFRSLPQKEKWSELMNEINSSNEFKKLIKSEEIVKKFKLVQSKPRIFDISTFRARFPDQSRVLYNWHQDEGTWYLSKNKNHQNKYPSTLWLSINGSSSNDSIQLVKYSHKKVLHNHSFVKGQGFFSASIKKDTIKENDIFTVETAPSEGLIFHPLALHRSVPFQASNLRPRYSIDVRYYDEDLKTEFNENYLFKLKRLYSRIFG